MSEKSKEVSVKEREELAPLELTQRDTSVLNWLDRGRFEHIQRIAKVFSDSSLVPVQYRGKMADCVIATQMAFRLDVDPFMFMQNTYVVHGRPGMEAKLAIALVNQRGPFDGPIQWKFSGKPQTDEWACTAFARHKATGDVCEATVTWAMVKGEGWLGKDGSKWKTMPEMMFRYRSATFLARLFCPEALMGMSTTDEAEDIGRTIIVEPTSRPLKANLETFTDLIEESNSESETEPVAESQPAPEAQPASANPPVSTPPDRGGNKPGRPPRRRATPDPDNAQPPETVAPEPSPLPPAPSPAPAPEPEPKLGRDVTNVATKIRILCSERPPAEWAEELTAAKFRGSATGTTWLAEYSEEAQQLADLAAGEPWCEATRLQ